MISCPHLLYWLAGSKLFSIKHIRIVSLDQVEEVFDPLIQWDNYCWTEVQPTNRLRRNEVARHYGVSESVKNALSPILKTNLCLDEALHWQHDVSMWKRGAALKSEFLVTFWALAKSYPLSRSWIKKRNKRAAQSHWVEANTPEDPKNNPILTLPLKKE